MPLGDTALRLRMALLVLGVLLSLFAGRLVQLQGFEAPAYADEAQRARMRTVELTAARGTVFDARGAALALSVEARDVTVDQTLVSDPEGTARALAPLVGEPVAELTAKLTGNRRFGYVARQVPPQTWSQIRALQLPGILSQKTTRRVYPGHDLAANVVGFVGSDGQGLSGLERTLDGRLAGKDGQASFEVAGGGRRIPTGDITETQPVRGRDVTLTLDRDLQWMAQQAIAAQVRASDADSGSVVVLDVRTGDVLALATAPSFDAANASAARRADRGNRPLLEVYEPGSTGKMLTAAAAIEENVVTPETEFTVPGRLERGGESFSDSHAHGTLALTFAGILVQSSNIGTILAAERMSPARLHDYLARFGLGARTGVGMPESPGILAAPEQWSASQRYTIPFGQGYSVTALQLASAAAAIANDGVHVAPRLVKGWTDEDGRFAPAPPGRSSRVVSPQTARTVREMLEGVVGPHGTAPAAAVPGYRIAGKTGTANRVDPRTGRYRGHTASFIGMAPADYPRLLVSVTLQDPQRGYYGGQLAAPVFKQVMSFALASQHVPPSGGSAPTLRLQARPDRAG